MPTSPTFYAQWELVEHKVQYETRKDTIILRGYAPVVVSIRKARPVILKTYEATIQDVNPSVAELPTPSYLSGANVLTPNPENLSPLGWEKAQWHCVDVEYSKGLSEPLSRKIRVSWEYFGEWFAYDSDDSDSQ